MSLRKRSKIQHCSTPKGKIAKQSLSTSRMDNFEQILRNDQKQNIFAYLNPKSTDLNALEKMQSKIQKILSAYQKLQEQNSQLRGQNSLLIEQNRIIKAENKKKNYVIQELEKQNSLFKHRIATKNDQNEENMQKFPNNMQIKFTDNRQQPAESYVIQRTFTPQNIHKQLNQKPSEILDSTAVKTQQNPKFPLPFTRINNQSKNKREDKNDIHLTMKSKGIQTQDQQFLDVLGKLKDRIKKYEEEEEVANYYIPPKIQIPPIELNNQFSSRKGQTPIMTLTRIKSHDFIHRQPQISHSKSKLNSKKQIHTLKQIWNQRDEQIKRMDQLFSHIDQRLNIAQRE